MNKNSLFSSPPQLNAYEEARKKRVNIVEAKAKGLGIGGAAQVTFFKAHFGSGELPVAEQGWFKSQRFRRP